MTGKVITVEFIVPTALSIVVAIVLSIGGVYLANCYLGPVDQPEVHVTSGR
jgi:hypothetical protein